MKLNSSPLTIVNKEASIGEFTAQQRIETAAAQPLQGRKFPLLGLLFSRLIAGGKKVKNQSLTNRTEGHLLTTSKSASLYSVPKGSRIIIVDVPDGRSRAKLIRLGIIKGEPVQCLERLPGGTVVIEKNRQEIAVGASLARAILVAYAA